MTSEQLSILINFIELSTIVLIVENVLLFVIMILVLSDKIDKLK